MTRLGDRLRRPLAEQPLTLAALVLLVAAIVALALASGASDRRAEHHRFTPQVTVPGPVIAPAPGRPFDPLTPRERARVRAAARQFLTRYLPYLYGRARAEQITGVTATVARGLRLSRARLTPAQRQRHPRLAGLWVVGQTARSAIVAATVADGGLAPYQLSFTLELHGRRWLVADLGND